MKKQVYYINAYSYFKGKDRDIIEAYFEDVDNGYAQLKTIYNEEEDSLDKLLIKHGYNVDDQVLVHINW